MKDIMVIHTLRISKDCKDAIELLKSKGVMPDRFFREGGEKRVILEAKKYNRLKLVKLKLPF